MEVMDLPTPPLLPLTNTMGWFIAPHRNECGRQGENKSWEISSDGNCPPVYRGPADLWEQCLPVLSEELTDSLPRRIGRIEARKGTGRSREVVMRNGAEMAGQKKHGERGCA